MVGVGLKVEFDEGVVKVYDMARLYDAWAVFRSLENSDEFYRVNSDMGGYEITEKLDLDRNELSEKRNCGFV